VLVLTLPNVIAWTLILNQYLQLRHISGGKICCLYSRSSLEDSEKKTQKITSVAATLSILITTYISKIQRKVGKCLIKVSRKFSPWLTQTSWLQPGGPDKNHQLSIVHLELTAI
jgi:hypothetical protein